MGDVVLRMEHITRDFPGVRALDDVTIEARAGEVLILAGENGAGKSTLMKILSGVWPASSFSGRITIRGEERRFGSTREAAEAGIAIIHQELNLIQDMSVGENIFLDRYFTRTFGIIDWDRVHAEAATILDRLRIRGIGTRDRVRTLPVGKQQMVEIAKALSLDASILVLDEPTSALTDRETEDLFRILRSLRDRGVCMIYISHKLDEFERIGDRVQVLRDGKTVGPAEPLISVSLDAVVSRMVNRDIREKYPKGPASPGAITLEVRHFEVDHPSLRNAKRVSDVSFCARKGEILGIAGLMGAGRTELVSGIFGALPDEARGEVLIDGRPVAIRSPGDAIAAGIALVTEDRKLLGLILDFSVRTNVALSSLRAVSNAIGVIDDLRERDLAGRFVDELGIRTPSIDTAAGALSGGNQQKVVIAKWLATESRILILDEPTRGVDVGAKVEIYRLMNDLVRRGVTVIMISSELPEIMGMSDRILVMCAGRLVADLETSKTTKEEVMDYATGNRTQEGAR
jgi:D-xylose transport system ATP-binding protein